MSGEGATLGKLLCVHSRRAEAVLTYFAALRASFYLGNPGDKLPGPLNLGKVWTTPKVKGPSPQVRDKKLDLDGKSIELLWQDNCFGRNLEEHPPVLRILLECLGKHLDEPNHVAPEAELVSIKSVIVLQGKKGVGKSTALKTTTMALADYLGRGISEGRWLVDQVPLPIYLPFCSAGEKTTALISTVLCNAQSFVRNGETKSCAGLTTCEKMLLDRLANQNLANDIAALVAKSEVIRLVDDARFGAAEKTLVTELLSPTLTFFASLEAFKANNGVFGSIPVGEYVILPWSLDAFQNFVGQSYRQSTPPKGRDEINSARVGAETFITSKIGCLVTPEEAAEWVAARLTSHVAVNGKGAEDSKPTLPGPSIIRQKRNEVRDPGALGRMRKKFPKQVFILCLAAAFAALSYWWSDPIKKVAVQWEWQWTPKVPGIPVDKQHQEWVPIQDGVPPLVRGLRVKSIPPFADDNWSELRATVSSGTSSSQDYSLGLDSTEQSTRPILPKAGPNGKIQFGVPGDAFRGQEFVVFLSGKEVGGQVPKELPGSRQVTHQIVGRIAIRGETCIAEVFSEDGGAVVGVASDMNCHVVKLLGKLTPVMVPVTKSEAGYELRNVLPRQVFASLELWVLKNADKTLKEGESLNVSERDRYCIYPAAESSINQTK